MSVSGKKALKALYRKGFKPRRAKGDHVVVSKEGVQPFVVPLHKELKEGLLHFIIKKSGDFKEGFFELM
jgi:predicted RNA binding protein YcfA (HicA-like mRNA interferase family)